MLPHPDGDYDKTWRGAEIDDSAMIPDIRGVVANSGIAALY
ncbi:MAG: hypothetical protein P4L91_15410 [Burkholderiaceae bacterium]|nr:hypothetical protein [Burkholderiaceae bacterium]